VTSSFLLICRRVFVHWRATVLLLILSCVAFLVARSDEFGRFELILLALLLVFIARFSGLGAWSMSNSGSFPAVRVGAIVISAMPHLRLLL
jgi:hypothetical protein